MPAAPVTESEGRTGYFGKVPARGDFVSRGLPREFVEPWDRWLQRGVAEGRARLGGDWPAVYRASPSWRFLLQAGLCGPAPAAGLLLPGTDRIGREYPFAIVCLPAFTGGGFGLAAGGLAWFAALEAATAGLLDGTLDPETLADRLAAAGPLPVAAEPGRARRSRLWSGLGPRVGLRAAVPPGPWPAAPWDDVPEGCSLWWTGGSATVAPSALLSRGLPRPDAFGAVWTGRWEGGGWREADAAARRRWPFPWLPGR